MFIAHLPAGYLIGVGLNGRVQRSRKVIAAAMAGAVAPDLDMIYFYAFDNGRTHHHDYVTHWPVFWLGLTTAFLMTTTILPVGWRRVGVAFLLGAMSHMLLDSAAAPVNWLAPFGSLRVELFPVPATQSHWILSFVLHWTFALELAICATALWSRCAEPHKQKTPDKAGVLRKS